MNKKSQDKQTTVIDKVIQRRLGLFGHVERMSADTILKNALHAIQTTEMNTTIWIDKVNEVIKQPELKRIKPVTFGNVTIKVYYIILHLFTFGNVII